MPKFIKGQQVIFQNFSGFVNFVSEHYITICIKETPKPKELAEHSKSKMNQVCICVYPDKWDQVLQTQQQGFWYFSTGYAEIVEMWKKTYLCVLFLD